MQLGLGLSGAASVMMEFAGVNGVTFHACGADSGAGKTLALRVSSSFWGHPTRFAVASDSSEIAVLEAAAVSHSLGVLIDESTTKQNGQVSINTKLTTAQQNAWARSLVYRFSEGNPKERSTTKGGIQVNNGSWKSLLFTTSNSYLMDSLAAQDTSNEAVLFRMLEAQFDKKIERLSEEERENMLALGECYGVTGTVYAPWVVQNKEVCATLFKKTRKRLSELLEERDGERFWFDGCAAIISFAISLGSKYANIVDIPITKLIEHCITPLIQNGRKYVSLSHKSADDVLNSYTRERYGQLVVVRKSEASKMLEAVLGHGALIDETISRSNIAGRVEHDVTPGRIDYYIEIKLLRQHCAAMGFSFEQFKRDMERKYHVEYLQKKDLLAKTKGPEMRVAAMRISKPDTSLEETGD